jgi:hypothetical protein
MASNRSLLVLLAGALWYALEFALAYGILLAGAWLIGAVAGWAR